MSEWKKVSIEVMQKAPLIVNKKKGELQIELAEALVEIERLQLEAQKYYDKMIDQQQIIDKAISFIKKYRERLDGDVDEKTGQMVYRHKLRLSGNQTEYLLQILKGEVK